MNDFLKLYNLEAYLLNEVHYKYHKKGKISAFDFFCIIIWKANRAKSKIAHKLLKKDSGSSDLNIIVEKLTSSIFNACDHKERMRLLLIEWDFNLPMASAILTIFYPDYFSIYDFRVCSTIGYECRTNKNHFDDFWQQYNTFLEKVKNAAPRKLTLRNKDRFLWGRSFSDDLIKNIDNLFSK